MIEKYIFHLLILLTLSAAAGVVTVRNIFHSALCLGAMLLGIAGIYLLLGTEFIFAVQVLVYVGGILVLIIFAIMLTSKIADKSVVRANDQKTASFAISALIFSMMAFAIVKTPFMADKAVFKVSYTENIGKYLFSNNILPFEVVSILLLAALVGAIVLARKDN